MNPFRGDVEIDLEGQRVTARLTLGALVELEQALGTTSLAELAAHFEAGRPSAAEVLAVVQAGLHGGGWRGEGLTAVQIAGGPLAAARAAGQLLARAFGGAEIS